MIIYKYLNTEAAIETIKEKSVLLSCPKKYNDPFDCDFYTPPEEIKKAFELFLDFELFKGLYGALTKSEAKYSRFRFLAGLHKSSIRFAVPLIKKNKTFDYQPFLKEYHNNIFKHLGKSKAKLEKEFNQMIKKKYAEIKKSVLASCFSLSFDSILLWSHYADKHRGACIEFEIDDDKNFRKMTYCQKKPTFQLFKALAIILANDFLDEKVDYNDEEYSFVLEPLFAKSLEWIYEKEVRCIYSLKKLNPSIYKKYKNIDGKKQRLLLLKMPKIKKIYLGCNMDKSSEKDIRECSGDIPVIRMKKKKDEYGLEFEEIMDQD